MKIEYDIKLPSTVGKIVNLYLKTLEKNVKYEAFTIDDKLNVIECKGIIENNENYNFHNNYDNSENELYVIDSHNRKTKKWFTLDKKEAVKIQMENIEMYKVLLLDELLRINKLLI